MNNKLLGFIVPFISVVSALCLCASAAPAIAEDTDYILENGIVADLSEGETETETESPSSAWTGTVSEQFGAGLGTKNFPYLIRTADEFALFAKVVNEQKAGFVDAYYKLCDNIDLGGLVWTPIGTSDTAPFKGCLDGNGYSVSNYSLGQGQYVGLFGYILNGTVKNLVVSDFTIDIDFTTSPEYDAMYVGGVSGYIYSTKGESNISCVSIKGGTIDINGCASSLYAGNIAGYAYSYISGKVNIVDSYAVANITTVNTGFSYVGGLVGQLYTGSGALSSIVHSYCTGSVSATSDSSCRAGGLVGYLFSTGSAYAPTGSASLLASDKDIMIKNSYSVTNVYSLSRKFTSRAGYIAGEINTSSTIQYTYYASSGITVTADSISTTLQTATTTTGTSTAISNLKSSSYLSNSRGFDFVNTWGISSEINDGFPYHLITTSEKPEIKTVEINIGAKASEGSIRYFESDGFQYPLNERADNLMIIAPEKDLLIEVVEKESADSLYTVGTKYYFVDYETLTYKELSGLSSYMGNKSDATIRTNKPVSIRFSSQITTSAKRETENFSIEEYGFIVGVKSLIDKNGSQLNFDFERYATGVAYDKKNNIDLIFDSRDDDVCIFTGILKNIPTQNYTTTVTSKNYTKITVDGNEFIVYGEPVNANMYDTAKELINTLEETDPQRAALQNIIDTVEATAA